MFEAYPPLSPHDPRFPHDPHFGYFGSAPLPPWPVLSTVGQGPKGDGIVIKAKVDKDGREYLEFWSTDPDNTEPLWVSPKFPERHSDDPDDPSSYTSLAKRVGAIRQAIPYAMALIQRWLWTRDGLSRTHTYAFRWNQKYVEPQYSFETDSDCLRMNLGQNMGAGIQLIGAVHQSLDPTDSNYDPRYPSIYMFPDDPNDDPSFPESCLSCTSITTPGSIVEPGAGTKNQRFRIEEFLDEYYTTHDATDIPTPREIAQAASVIVPWEFPDGYIMYPLVEYHPTDVSSSNRYSVKRGLAVRASAYGTDTIGIYFPEALLNDPQTTRYAGFTNGTDGQGNPIFIPSNRVWVASSPRRRSLIRKDYLYLQKNYYSTSHDVSVVLPFGLSGDSITPGNREMYYDPLVSTNSDYKARFYSPDSRVINFSDRRVLNESILKKVPWSPAHRTSYEVARKAARVMIEFCMGNGRGLYYSEADNGQPYVDPVYNEWILNPDAWRLGYNKKHYDWTGASSSNNYYQSTDRMVDWRQDHDVNPMIRGLFFYSRNNSTQFRMFPAIRPKNLTQSQLITALSGMNTPHTEAYYLRSMGADCSSTVALAYYAPVGTYGFNKSEDNQFWIPNLAGASGVCGDLVAAAAPGVPLDLSQAKPGDLIMFSRVYTDTAEHVVNQTYTNHVAMVVSTPSDPIISSADLLDLHYPVYEVPDFEDPNASMNYDKSIKFFKHLTMDDVRTKVIVMHTSSSTDPAGHEMYKDANGDWQFSDQANRPLYPTMNPVIVANNDAEHFQQYQSFRYLCRWSHEETDSVSTGDNMRNNDPSTYIYRWVTKLIEQVENDEINLFPTWDEDAAEEFDFGGLPDDGSIESDTVEDPNQTQPDPVDEELSNMRGQMRRGPVDDSTWYEPADDMPEGA